MFTGLKSIIYPSTDLDADKKFWENITGVAPYFDQPYYVGFSINGCELGLDPNASNAGLTYPVTYWHVDNTKEAAKKIVADGATVFAELKDVGEGMMMGTFKDLNGNIFGIIDNPNSET